MSVLNAVVLMFLVREMFSLCLQASSVTSEIVGEEEGGD